jgi:hypothetical protein
MRRLRGESVTSFVELRTGTAGNDLRVRRENPLIQIASGKLQCLGDILVGKSRVFGFQVIPVRIQSCCRDDAAHGEPHAPVQGCPFMTAGLTVILSNSRDTVGASMVHNPI